MRLRSRLSVVCCSLLATGVGVELANAHSMRAERLGRSLVLEPNLAGSAEIPDRTERGSQGASLALTDGGLLVAERNAGVLVRTDSDGAPLQTLALHEGVTQVVRSASGATYVADPRADRVVIVDVMPSALRIVAELPVRDPYGLALSPAGDTVYVTSVADQVLVAFDTKSRVERWRIPLRAEPRSVAVSHDGREATVGFLSAGVLAVVDLGGERPTVRWQSLNPREPVEVTEEDDDYEGTTQVASITAPRSRFEVPSDEGRRQAGSVFSVGYIGNGLLVAPHLLSTPQMKRIPSSEMQDSYGGGPEMVPAISSRLAVLASPGTEAARGNYSMLSVHQPRAMAYDPGEDTLYLAGYGDDAIVAVADVSQPTPYLDWEAVPKLATGRHACGPDGLVSDGEHVWVHCELSRTVMRITPSELDLEDSPWIREKHGVHVGPELAASVRGEQIERGAELFRRGRDSSISDLGVMACSSCHPDGRQDGLTWRLGKSILQTPMLAGRLTGTAPFKWSGEDADLTASFRHTIERLGGVPDNISRTEYLDLAAYVTSLPRPKAPASDDPTAVARGQSLFNGTLGCVTCHAGDALTDTAQYPLESRGLSVTDTPSLIGLGHSAPYYHDGSAADLHALVTDRANVHDMADFSTLHGTQADDLVAYLRTL